MADPEIPNGRATIREVFDLLQDIREKDIKPLADQFNESCLSNERRFTALEGKVSETSIADASRRQDIQWRINAILAAGVLIVGLLVGFRPSL